MSDEKKLEHEYEYDDDGKLVGAKLSREKLFRDRWDSCIDIRFYSKQHIQRISLNCNKFLGEQGKDWDSYAQGFNRVADIIRHNQESDEEMKDQVFVIGLKENGNNDVEGFQKALKRLKLKYLMSGVQT